MFVAQGVGEIWEEKRQKEFPIRIELTDVSVSQHQASFRSTPGFITPNCSNPHFHHPIARLVALSRYRTTRKLGQLAVAQ